MNQMMARMMKPMNHRKKMSPNPIVPPTTLPAVSASLPDAGRLFTDAAPLMPHRANMTVQTMIAQVIFRHLRIASPPFCGGYVDTGEVRFEVILSLKSVGGVDPCG